MLYVPGWDDGHEVGGRDGDAAARARLPFIRRERLIAEFHDGSCGPVRAGSRWSRLREDHGRIPMAPSGQAVDRLADRTAQHNDPVVLLADLVRLLDEFEPLEPRARQRLSAVSVDFSSVMLPRLEDAVSHRARPFVLVIDDAHRLRRR